MEVIMEGISMMHFKEVYLQDILSGMSDKEIAKKRCVAENTVYVYRKKYEQLIDYLLLERDGKPPEGEELSNGSARLSPEYFKEVYLPDILAGLSDEEIARKRGIKPESVATYKKYHKYIIKEAQAQNAGETGNTNAANLLEDYTCDRSGFWASEVEKYNKKFRFASDEGHEIFFNPFGSIFEVSLNGDTISLKEAERLGRWFLLEDES
jgi:DNA-binding CsgD family transcriptional regulator